VCTHAYSFESQVPAAGDRVEFRVSLDKPTNKWFAHQVLILLLQQCLMSYETRSDNKSLLHFSCSCAAVVLQLCCSLLQSVLVSCSMCAH